ncbi:MAG: GntR family transcriptional regulator [FCB group bacterium]|nr:GntR family transcriptional regulator [FCB group bacterium]
MELNLNNDTPIYQQIAQMIRKAIIAGDLKEGSAIPSVRQISVEYKLNPQTILNATQILIQEGAIEKKRGLGMFVCTGAREKLITRESDIFRTEKTKDYIARGKILGYTEKQLCGLIKEKYEEV